MTSNKIYNPASQPKEWLIKHFVVRTKVFEKIFKDIFNSEMKYPEQHYLLQGQRGMGKTTLLLRLKYEIENTPKLNSWLVPVFFNEESYDLTTLSNLWEKLLKYLDNLWHTGGKYYKKTDEFVGKTDYEKKCFEWLLEILKSEQKKIVILFDNFGQLFLDELSDKEQHRFREILMHCAEIRIIGASAIVLDELYDYSKPFYEFFKIINLEGLNSQETIHLIKKLQEGSEKKIDINKNKAKIETLTILAGGVIRTVMLIYEVILADSDGSALQDLETILDRITPLYKHRIEDLPSQQRKIVDVIARKWDAISTREIGENIRENGQPMPTKLISAQLQQLEKNNVIEKKKTNTKNHLYQLKERFFNIWYLMRHGNRNDKCKVIWLTKFLEMWYDDERSFSDFFESHILHLRSGKYHTSSALLMVEALTRSSKVDFNKQTILIEETSKILNDEQRRLLPQIHLESIKKAVDLLKNNKFQEAIDILEPIETKDDRLNLFMARMYLKVDQLENSLKSIMLVKEESSFKTSILGEICLEQEKYDEALKYFLSLIKDKVDAGLNLHKAGFVYEIGKKNLRKALSFYLLSLREGNLEVYEDIINIYNELKQFKNVEKTCLEAIKLGKEQFKKDLIDLYLGKIYKPEEAKQLIEKGIYDDPSDPDYYYLKGVKYYINNNLHEAKELLNQALSLYKDDSWSNVRFIMSHILLMEIYILEKNKSEAFTLVNKLKDIDPLASMMIMVSSILVWAEEYRQGFNLISKYCDNVTSQEIEDDLEDLQFLFSLLIAKKQYNFSLQILQNGRLDLKERFKPIYYALMHLMKDEYPNEYLKMGDELKKPVEDVLKKIEQMAIDYA